MKKYIIRKENWLLFSILLYLVINALWGSNNASDVLCADTYTTDDKSGAYNTLFNITALTAYLTYPIVWNTAKMFRLLQLMHIGFSVVLVIIITANSTADCTDYESFAGAFTTANTCKLLFSILQFAWIILSAGVFITQKRKPQ